MNIAGLMKPKYMNSASELVFIYNKAEKEILFHSLPLDSFFGSVNMQTEPFFANSFEDDLSKEWQRCLQLNENETHNFSRTAISADNNPVEFNFHVVGINLHSPAHKKLLLFIIRRALLLKTSQDYGKDYAEFIDLAAHDLDAPLRKISLLTERLAHKSKSGHIPDIEDYIGRIQANITDMRQLVDSLTTLARINSALHEKDLCDPGDIVGEISNRWEERLRSKKLKLSVSPLPRLYGNCGQLKQLFGNLLDNSIKFCKETGGSIWVNSSVLTQEERQLLNHKTEYGKITVADDGIGFRDEYANKIFEPFVRLNARSRYPGSGMGLAICKKIVENNNGIIYAKGEENKGADFTIILPQSPD